MFKTADLYDAHGAELSVAQPLLRHYGGRRRFCGQILTVQVYEDNALVRKTLDTTDGKGKVLVVDGGASLRVALVGDRLAEIAVRQGWEGVVVNGCIRDSVECAQFDFGLMALATIPVKPHMKGHGESGFPVAFAGVKFTPGEWLYADEDGIVTSARSLL